MSDCRKLSKNEIIHSLEIEKKKLTEENEFLKRILQKHIDLVFMNDEDWKKYGLIMFPK